MGIRDQAGWRSVLHRRKSGAEKERFGEGCRLIPSRLATAAVRASHTFPRTLGKAHRPAATSSYLSHGADSVPSGPLPLRRGLPFGLSHLSECSISSQLELTHWTVFLPNKGPVIGCLRYPPTQWPRNGTYLAGNRSAASYSGAVA